MDIRRFRLLLPLAALFAALPAGAESLLEVYQRALQSDPLIREAEANRRATEEAVPQARGLLLPQLSASASESRGTAEGASAFQQVSPTGETITVTSDFQDESIETTQWQIELRQTVFRWDQFVGLKQAGKQVARAEADFEAAQQDLIVRVANRYFEVLAAEDALEAAQASKRAIDRQLEQAQQRFEVGLIAITDVQEAQAAYDQAIADEIAAKRQLASSREFLREITGEYLKDLETPGQQLTLETPDPAEEDDWVNTAFEQNLALIAARLNAEIASQEIDSRRSGHYPTLDLVATRSDFDREFERSNEGGPFNDVFNNQTSDSIALEFRIPLFSGGRTSAQVREAVHLHRAAREQLQRVARETERQARDAYLGVLAEISRVKALRQALSSAKTALEATEAGFEVGTRTTVDVLDAQQQVFSARTNYRRARYDYLLNVLRLKQAAGILRIQDLEDIDAILVPRSEMGD
ncbi:TolC family outer membrane protein [Lentisalinibacter orientalis]|uniref:TolC family outer membrane protein n=1 Tax=Lentisalinibacter orientalis TaxID=2992241 RepID=UPI00386F6AAE